MIHQKDRDGNVVLVMTPTEAASLIPIAMAAGLANVYEVSDLTEADAHVINGLSTAALHVPDSALIDGLMSAHAGHEDDDFESLREIYTDLVTRTRKVHVDRGLVEG